MNLNKTFGWTISIVDFCSNNYVFLQFAILDAPLRIFLIDIKTVMNDLENVIEDMKEEIAQIGDNFNSYIHNGTEDLST